MKKGSTQNEVMGKHGTKKTQNLENVDRSASKTNRQLKFVMLKMLPYCMKDLLEEYSARQKMLKRFGPILAKTTLGLGLLSLIA